VIGPIVAHRHVILKFSDAGYIECGPFEKTPKVDRKQSIFNSRAWVLDSADCPGVGARPPPFDWRNPPIARYDSIQ
jgi:hypothetical protein